MNKWIEFRGANIPSKKNSKMITKNKRIISSKLVREREKLYGTIFQSNLKKWQQQLYNEQYPIYLGIYFYRDSKRQWDFNNITQFIQDMMVSYLYIPDDSTKYIIPIYMGEEVVKKNEAGFKMKIINKEDYLKIIENNL